jgi:hypothetical protein
LGNDLEFFDTVVKFLLQYYEETEEYEKCELLQNKLNESMGIKNQGPIKKPNQ